MCDFRLALALPLPVGIGKLSRETGVTFARSYVGGVETAIAFAGAKWVFLACFSVAEVLAVSCWPASAVAEVSLVSISPRRCALCAKKFVLHTKNGPKSAFVACWANLFANIPLDGARWANYFAPVVAKVVILMDSSSNRAVL